MITRYLKPISITSTTFSDFINAIVSAFVDVGFTEVVTPTSGITNARAVQFGNLEIDIYQSVSVCAFKSYLHYTNEDYAVFSTVLNLSGATPYGCNLAFFVSGDEKFIAVNVAAKTEQPCKGQFNFFNVITDNEEICGVTRKETNNSMTTEFCSTNRYPVLLQPKRTYSKEENLFFLDEGIPSINNNNGRFIMDLPYLVTLGGAERSYTYTMSNGDNYYCLIDNIAVKFDTTVFPQTGT